MRSIKVQRAIIGNGILEPVKCSDNMQLAINCTNHITIVEPKLPLLHSCVEPSNESEASVLDSTALFDVRSVCHIENLESIGLQIFSKLLLEDGENMFNFGRIHEPIVVSHSWSPVDPSTRDCYLGVLLNTGEVLIFKRNTMDANNYSVKFRSFTFILEMLALPKNRLTAEGDIILTKDQFSKLRITNFSFGKMQNGSLIANFAHENGDVTIYELSEELKLLHSISTGGLVTKLLWSVHSMELYYTLSDNSTWSCTFGLDPSINGVSKRLKYSSRFLISHIFYSDTLKGLIITDTKAIHFVSRDSSLTSLNLPHHTTIVNVSTIESDSCVSVLLPYESGNVCVAKIDVLSGEIVLDQKLVGWESFHAETLLKYQISLVREQNKASSKMFSPYLVDTCEPKLSIYGFSPLTNSGLVAVVYGLAPANVVSHVVKSRTEFNVGWFSLNMTNNVHGQEFDFHTSTLPYLSSLLICHKDRYPRITKEIKEGSESALQTFANSLKSWKLSVFEDPACIELFVKTDSSLLKSLTSNFRENRQIHLLQKHYIMNVSLMKTLQAIITTSGKPCNALKKELVTIGLEQDIIVSKILTQLALIVVLWASQQPVNHFESPLDLYLLNTYSIVLLRSNIEQPPLPIPDFAKLIISTDLCTEIFEISRKDPVSSNYQTSVVSSSNHTWPRCDMTLLPILSLTNKMDEVETHNYLSTTKEDSYILGTIFDCLSYCIFTGTRLFDLKVGV